MKLIDPEVWHILFALAGALIGWWLRHQWGNTGIPAELADALRGLLQKKQQQEAHGLLEELLAAIRPQQQGQQKPTSGG
jgi:hypothetical protein